MEYGYKQSRFEEYKRAVFDKDIGPIIGTVMNRCIHCTRCIRFGEEVGGVYDMGTMGRGEATEVGTYVENMVDSELSGNIADLCPVGALVSKPHSFMIRNFEVRKTNSIDLMESIIPSVEMEHRGGELIRILPRVNEDVNEEWISDKSRYAYDGLKRQRLVHPLIQKRGEFKEATWKQVLTEIANNLKKS